ncbi:hypothetical protein [Paenibacillus puerhi]|uniref:hypothetical protein n=1 Tax=Paenibacillus puerhi TaxID=2692622 RepID=UPI00135C3B12|nr:hypothetical protein [Paenibacillus puerhi]
MTYDTIFWLLLGVGFVMTGIVGIWPMWKTEKLGMSFLAGSVVNTLIAGGSIWWWASVFNGEGQEFSKMFGIFGYGVSYVNNEVLLFFALLGMKRKIGGDGPPVYEPHPDDD